ncbi:site-specific integrase [Vagococcus sp. PNs007]|uniref:Site-specific integrase n=1 Tax=Vagococcus proximus TaxID=2991417 RepID=A0ABT5WZ84_9ENTE|nr:site-specific integrase [Vagococcus proximus]MDF0478962.1 site-specific integrase [Vagococcus proximus]
MSLIIRDAVRRGFLTYNPIQYVKMPRFVVSVKDSKEELNDSYLSNSEIKDLTLKIDNYSDIIYRTLFQVMLQTGMRVSEVLALKKEDIDCDNNVIKVYKTLYRPGNAIKNYELTSPKTRFSTRAVYVSEELIDKLKILIKLIENERRVEVFQVDDDFLFIYLKSRFRDYPITKGQVNRRLLKVIEKTTIKKEFTSHKFRHVHITQLAEAGVSLKAIKERVGHIDSKVTEQIYLHVTQEERKNIPEKLQLFLNQV